MRNLEARSLDVALGVYDDVCFRTGNLDQNAHTKGYGYDEFYGPLLSNEDNWEWAGFSIYRDWNVDPMTPLRTILEASKRSAYRVRFWDFDLCCDRSFPLSGSGNSEAIKDGSFHRRIRQILTTQTTLPRKWTLNPGVDFSLRWWDSGDYGGLELEMRIVTDNQRFECKSSNAQAGHMGQFERINSSCISLRAALGHNIFREARFESIKTRSSEMIVFLQKHDESLRRLEFSNVELKGSREEFLQVLRDCMSLDYLEWHDFVIGQDDTSTRSARDTPMTKRHDSGLFIGKEKVSAALNALIIDVPEMNSHDLATVEQNHWPGRGSR